MVVDLAHASSATIREALELVDGPVIVSHGGVKGHCHGPCSPRRNLSDEDILAIARNDGVIGVGYWPEPVASGVDAIVASMTHVVQVLEREPGIDLLRHLALGSDFDSVVTTPLRCCGGLPLLVARLRERDALFSG
jgi:microsomal dipeptidase-like Zn-dependent dipeptidase